MSLSKKRWQNYIGGEWHDPAAGDWIEIEDPATAEPAFSAPRGQKVDIDAAVAAARSAIDSRAVYEMAPHDRMILLLKVAAELRKMADEIAPVITVENGKSISLARDEVEDAARYFEYYAGLAGKLHGRQIPPVLSVRDRGASVLDRSPAGVTAPPAHRSLTSPAGPGC